MRALSQLPLSSPFVVALLYSSGCPITSFSWSIPLLRCQKAICYVYAVTDCTVYTRRITRRSPLRVTRSHSDKSEYPSQSLSIHTSQSFFLWSRHDLSPWTFVNNYCSIGSDWLTGRENGGRFKHTHTHLLSDTSNRSFSRQDTHCHFSPFPIPISLRFKMMWHDPSGIHSTLSAGGSRRRGGRDCLMYLSVRWKEISNGYLPSFGEGATKAIPLPSLSLWWVPLSSPF